VSPELTVFLMFLSVLVGILLLGYYVAFVLGGLALIFGLIGWGPQVFDMFVNRLFGLMTSYELAAVPLFVFMGVMLERSGVAETLYSAMHVWMGPLRGGLAMGTILICTIFAATTGIIGASVVTMGLLALPAMLRRGYDRPLTTGAICAGGTLGILIPPSIMLVLYGPAAGLSVGRLFMGAIFPGLVLSGLYIAYIAVRCFFNPRLGPPLPPEERRLPLGYKLRLGFTSLLPPIFLILAVLGTIFFGIAAPTEAAAMGASGSLLIAAAYRRLRPDVIRETLEQTFRVSSMILVVAVGATLFTGVFLGLGGGKVAEEFLTGLPFGRWGIFATIMLIIFVFGALLDWISILLIFIPILTPIIKGLGFDPLWFALVVCVNLQTSFLTPPMAPAIFYLQGVAPKDVTVAHMYRGIVPFVLLQLVGLALIILFPQIALWLPARMIR